MAGNDRAGILDREMALDPRFEKIASLVGDRRDHDQQCETDPEREIENQGYASARNKLSALPKSSA